MFRGVEWSSMSSRKCYIQMNVWIQNHLPAKQCENEKAPQSSFSICKRCVCVCVGAIVKTKCVSYVEITIIVADQKPTMKWDINGWGRHTKSIMTGSCWKIFWIIFIHTWLEAAAKHFHHFSRLRMIIWVVIIIISDTDHFAFQMWSEQARERSRTDYLSPSVRQRAMQRKYIQK